MKRRVLFSGILSLVAALVVLPVAVASKGVLSQNPPTDFFDNQGAPAKTGGAPDYYYGPPPWPQHYRYPGWNNPPPYYYPPGGYDRRWYEEDFIPAGRLVIYVDPVDAAVFVDGHRLRQRDDLSYHIGLLSGKHTVEVKADGYESYRREVDILQARKLYLTVRLTKQ